MRESTKKARFFGLLSKLCSKTFVENVSLMADMANVINDLKNLLETLQNQNTTLPKAYNQLAMCTKQIERHFVSARGHSLLFSV